MTTTPKTGCPRCTADVALKADGEPRKHCIPDTDTVCQPVPASASVPKFRLPRR